MNHYTINLSQSYIKSIEITQPEQCINLENIIKKLIDDGENVIDCRLIRNGYEILILVDRQ